MTKDLGHAMLILIFTLSFYFSSNYSNSVSIFQVTVFVWIQKMDAKKVFEEFKPKLVRLLPLKDPLFTAELTRQNLFSGNLKEEVMEARTQADAADRFLDEAVERPLNIGYKEPFDKLLLVMEKFDNLALKRLAGEINQKFRVRHG